MLNRSGVLHQAARVKSDRNESELPPPLPPKRSADLSAWKNFGDLIEIGQTSQRCICTIDDNGTIAAARRAGDSRSPPDVERADIRPTFTVATSSHSVLRTELVVPLPGLTKPLARGQN
jgi:hypothetical protein